MIRLLRFLPSRWWSLQGWKTWGEYVHWRLETYGVYYPAGQFNRQAFVLLVKQLPSYIRWISEINRIRRMPLRTRS